MAGSLVVAFLALSISLRGWEPREILGLLFFMAATLGPGILGAVCAARRPSLYTYTYAVGHLLGSFIRVAPVMKLLPNPEVSRFLLERHLELVPQIIIAYNAQVCARSTQHLVTLTLQHSPQPSKLAQSTAHWVNCTPCSDAQLQLGSRADIQGDVLCASQASLPVMAVLHGVRQLSIALLCSHVMDGITPCYSCYRWVVNWVILMTLQCGYELRTRYLYFKTVNSGSPQPTVVGLGSKGPVSSSAQTPTQTPKGIDGPSGGLDLAGQIQPAAANRAPAGATAAAMAAAASSSIQADVSAPAVAHGALRPAAKATRVEGKGMQRGYRSKLCHAEFPVSVGSLDTNALSSAHACSRLLTIRSYV